MDAFALQLGWRKKAPRRLTDAIYAAVANLPVAIRVLAVNAATATLVEDAFGEASPPQPEDIEEAVSNFAFVAANLFQAAAAQQEAIDQLLLSAAALAARTSVSQGRAGTTAESPARSSPPPVRPPVFLSTAAAVTDATAARQTRPRCAVCRHTVDSCTCNPPGEGVRGSGAPLTRQPPPPPPPHTRTQRPPPPEPSDHNSEHSSDRTPPSQRSADSDAQTVKTTASRSNRRPGTFKDPGVLWEPALWHNEIADGGSARDLERELLRASGSDSLPQDSFPKELSEALAQICAEWAEHPESQLVPELILELLFRQKLWSTPGADKAGVDQAMRKVRAQALPDKFRKAAATLEAKARKANDADRRAPARASADPPRPARTPAGAPAARAPAGRARLPKALWESLSADQKAMLGKK